MAWPPDFYWFGSNVQPGAIALVVTAIIGAILLCHQLPRHLFPSQPKPKDKVVKKDIFVRIQDIPVEKSLVELKNDLASLVVQDQQLETTINGLDRVTFARINNDDACATAIFPTVFSQSELLRRLGQASKEAGLPYGFDCDFFGITPLTDADGDDAVDIVAIPGLASHPIGSWKSSQKGNSKVWLRDFLPRDIPNARILLYGYDTKLLGSDSRQSIEDMSIMLLNLLSSFRAEDRLKRRPIIFIGHSLGGLLVKECLLQAMKRQNYQSHHAVYQACCGLLLFGVPNHGLNNSQLLSIVQNQANESLIRDLVLDKHLEPSMFLKRISNDFSERCGSHSPVVCFYETRLSPTVQMLPNGTLKKSGPSASMVTTHSATAFVGEAGEPAVPFNVDHSGLVKFDSRSHELYVVVLDRLKRLVTESRARLRKRGSDNLSSGDQKLWNTMNDPPYSAFRNSAKLPKPEEGTLEWLIQKSDEGPSHDRDPEFLPFPREQDEELLRPEAFQRWRDASESTCLLVTAPPGSGKSVLSNFVVGHLEAFHGSKIIYYFCSMRADETVPGATSVLRSLIVQLCEARATLFRLLPADWTEAPINFKGAGLPRLLDIFGQLLRHAQFTQVYCIIDGLDVYDDPAMIELVYGLRKICKLNAAVSNAKIHLFCTSRPTRKLLDAWGLSESCRLRCDRDDIATFVEQRVLRLGSDFNHGLKDFIQNQLLEKSEQTFLWLDVVFRRIESLELPTQTEVTREIESSSHDLDGLYQFLIERAAAKGDKLVRILSMVTFSRIPLTCAELEHAVAIDVAPITETHSYGNFIKNVAHLDAAAITKVLGTLIDVVEGKAMVIHQSLRDFFQRSWESLPLSMNINPTVYPAYVLMKYLCLIHEDMPIKSFQLLVYAHHSWYRQVTSEVEIYTHTPLRHVLEHLLSSDPGSSYSSRKGDLFSRTITENRIARNRFARNPKNIALRYDIGWLINVLLDNQIDGFSRTDITPAFLLQAVQKHAKSVLKCLLDHGNQKTLPLSCDIIEKICEKGHADTVELLLDERVDEVHFTSRMLSRVARNNRLLTLFDQSDALVKLMLSKCGSDIQITSEMVLGLARYCTSTVLEAVFEMENCDTEITTAMLEEISANGPHASTLAFLLNRSRGKVQVTETMLVDAACWLKGGELMEIFFSERDEEIYITDNVLEAAVGNSSDAPRLLELFFKKRHNDIRITEVVIIRAIQNGTYATDIVEKLFTEREAEIHVTDKVLTTAARNGRGKDLLEMLFHRRGHEVHLTTEILDAAASNPYTTAAIRFVCDCMGEAFEVTPELLTTAAGSRMGEETLKFLFEKGGSAIPIPPQAIMAAAGNSPGALHFLLSEASGRIAVTEDVLLAAIDNMWKSPLLLTNLLKYGGSNIQITPKVALAAAEAVYTDDFSLLKVPPINLLLKVDRSIISMAHEGYTLLTLASENGDFVLVDRLLEIGANPDFTAANKRTALLLATERGHCEVVELLVRNGSNTNVEDLNGFSPLASASMGGRHEIIDVLLRGGADVAARTTKGWSSLALASYRGHYKAAELLLRAGSDPTVETDDGRCCLVLACQRGHFEIATLLLSTIRQDLADHPDLSSDYVPLLTAETAKDSRLDMPSRTFDFLIGKKDGLGRTIIWYAAAGGHVSLLKSILERHLEAIDERDSFGITPLSAAARRGRLGVVHVLLASGFVQLESQDCIGKTALWWAEKLNQPVMVQVLSHSCGKLADDSIIRQQAIDADFLALGYCDVCLVAIPSLQGALYECGHCGIGQTLTIICECCVQEGAHCLKPLHKLRLRDGTETS